MTISRLYLRMLLLGLWICPAIAGAGEFCATSTPESILTCLSDAYSHHDLSAYSTLLADDYGYYLGSNVTAWSRDMELKSARMMFDPDSCRNLSLTFAPGYQVLPSDAKDTWVIKNLVITIALDSMRHANPGHFESVARDVVMKVRRVAEPVVHFELYYWWNPLPTIEATH